MFINKKCSHLSKKYVVLRGENKPVEEKKVVKKTSKTEKIVEVKEENNIA